MAKLLKQYEWNNKFYCMAELDNGSSIELKSLDGKNFEELLKKYNDLAMLPIVEEDKSINLTQKELDDYALTQWIVLAKEAEKKTPMTTEKTVSEWLDKITLVSAESING